MKKYSILKFFLAIYLACTIEEKTDMFARDFRSLQKSGM